MTLVLIYIVSGKLPLLASANEVVAMACWNACQAVTAPILIFAKVIVTLQGDAVSIEAFIAWGRVFPLQAGITTTAAARQL